MKNNLLIGIYKITSPNGKIYIGQSVNIEKRFNSYRKLQCKLQRKLYNSLLKYGSENHKFEIIKKCEINELDKYEVFYINLFESFNNINGLNLKQGGKLNTFLSNETKLKISDNHKKKGIKPPSRLGFKNSESHIQKCVYARRFYKHSIETIEKIKKSNTGENNYNYGKKSWNNGLKFDTKTNKNNKKVVQMDLNGNYINEFPSARIANKETGFSYQKISLCCNGKRNKCGNYKWKFN